MAAGVLESERVALARKIGPTGTIMVTALARLYLASPNKRAHPSSLDPVLQEFRDLTDKEWKYTHIMGFVVLVVDHRSDTLLLRVYQFKTLELRFEYEVYVDMEYKLLDPQFHSFEMENCIAGLSFSVKSDAITFHQKMSALKPTSKDSAATILRKMRSSLYSASSGSSSGNSEGPEKDAHATRFQPTKTFVDCTPDQIKMFKEYQQACKRYEDDLAKYKAEQDALKKYEADKKQYEVKWQAYMKAKAERGSEDHSSQPGDSVQSQKSHASSEGEQKEGEETSWEGRGQRVDKDGNTMQRAQASAPEY